MPIAISKHPPMTPSRPCRYCLSLQGGSVFADFDVDLNELVFLIRISFDGYGCCKPEDAARTMNIEDSSNFIGWLESNNLDHDGASAALTKYFDANSDIIWRDALLDHALLDPDTAHDAKH